MAKTSLTKKEKKNIVIQHLFKTLIDFFFVIFNVFYFLVTEPEQFIINDESKNPRENIDMIEEENEDFMVFTKVETAEISEPELEAVEKTIEPELKAEDETFEETKELGEFKAESAERAERAAPKSKDLKIVAQNL